MRATRRARSPNLQVAFTHAQQVRSQRSFVLHLRMNGMNRTQSDHACLDLLTLVIWLHAKHERWNQIVLTFYQEADPSCIDLACTPKPWVITSMLYYTIPYHICQCLKLILCNNFEVDVFWESDLNSSNSYSKGAFLLSELTGQTVPFVMRISLLIKAIQLDQSNPQ